MNPPRHFIDILPPFTGEVAAEPRKGEPSFGRKIVDWYSSNISLNLLALIKNHSKMQNSQNMHAILVEATGIEPVSEVRTP